MKRISIRKIVFVAIIVSACLSVFQIFSFNSRSPKPSKWKNIFIALNLRNNADLIPKMTDRFDNLISLLGQSKLFFSIFSNNNQDDTDLLIEHHFKPLLQQRGIAHKIVTNGTTCGGHTVPPKEMNRIEWLACVRNSAMEPFYNFVLSKQSDDTLVLFFNDIVFSPNDIVDLMETQNGDFDLACGLDFYYNFYDIWVTRGIDGKYFSAFPPFAMDFKSALGILKSVSPIVGSATDGVAVKCCWNGVAAIRGSKFLGENPISFRSEISKECNTIQSECKLFCEDLGNERKVFINPNVIVAYSEVFYWMNKLIRNFFIYSIFFISRIFEFRFNTTDGERMIVMQCEGETKTAISSVMFVLVVCITLIGLVWRYILKCK
jgi:hypothetical protein